MNYLFAFYAGVAVFWILFTTMHKDIVEMCPFFPWRFGFALSTAILWPAVLAFGLYSIQSEEREKKLEKIKSKEDILFHYLLWNSPDWRKKYVFEKEDKEFLYTYMKDHFPNGIYAIRNPSVGRTEFALMVEQEVKHPIHEHGFCKGVTEWYTKGRD